MYNMLHLKTMIPSHAWINYNYKFHVKMTHFRHIALKSHHISICVSFPLTAHYDTQPVCMTAILIGTLLLV